MMPIPSEEVGNLSHGSRLAVDTIVSYHDTIMDHVPSRVRRHRDARGWTQAELARRANVSRAAVSAVEIGRLVPSVEAALALAAALGCTVEDLFGRAPAAGPGPAWAWLPTGPTGRFWVAEIGGRVLRFPAEATAAGVVPHDGFGDDPPAEGPDPRTTLVLAGCDPAAGLLAGEYARQTGFRLLALPRSGGEALGLLGRGLVHAAGVHYATAEEPDANRSAVRDRLGPGHRLVRVARWDEGLALGTGVRASSIGGAVRGRLRWVGREPGSAAANCLAELRGGRPAPRRVARDHRGVAEAVRAGWADVGVCHRLAAAEAGLGFLTVRSEAFDLCYPAASAGDPRVAALVRVVRSPEYRRLLGELPGFDTSAAGVVDTVE
jgi:molybdate-binding protein/transcriptional regulator with XRE-family HTH domain